MTFSIASSFVVTLLKCSTILSDNQFGLNQHKNLNLCIRMIMKVILFRRSCPNKRKREKKKNIYTNKISKASSQKRKIKQKRKQLLDKPILVTFYNTNGNFMLPIHHCNNFHFPIKNQTLKKNCLLKELLIEHYNGHNKLLSTKYE